MKNRRETKGVWRRTAGWVVAAMMGVAAPAIADSWNDKTILKFSQPVMVAGRRFSPAATCSS